MIRCLRGSTWLADRNGPIAQVCEDRRCPAFGRVHRDDAELITCTLISECPCLVSCGRGHVGDDPCHCPEVRR